MQPRWWLTVISGLLVTMKSKRSAALSWEHPDPADRLIVATTRVYQSSLATADERIRESGLVGCIWE